MKQRKISLALFMGLFTLFSPHMQGAEEGLPWTARLKQAGWRQLEKYGGLVRDAVKQYPFRATLLGALALRFLPKKYTLTAATAAAFIINEYWFREKRGLIRAIEKTVKEMQEGSYGYKEAPARRIVVIDKEDVRVMWGFLNQLNEWFSMVVTQDPTVDRQQLSSIFVQYQTAIMKLQERTVAGEILDEDEIKQQMQNSVSEQLYSFLTDFIRNIKQRLDKKVFGEIINSISDMVSQMKEGAYGYRIVQKPILQVDESLFLPDKPVFMSGIYTVKNKFEGAVQQLLKSGDKNEQSTGNDLFRAVEEYKQLTVQAINNVNAEVEENPIEKAKELITEQVKASQDMSRIAQQSKDLLSREWTARYKDMLQEANKLTFSARGLIIAGKVAGGLTSVRATMKLYSSARNALTDIGMGDSLAGKLVRAVGRYTKEGKSLAREDITAAFQQIESSRVYKNKLASLIREVAIVIDVGVVEGAILEEVLKTTKSLPSRGFDITKIAQELVQKKSSKINDIARKGLSSLMGATDANKMIEDQYREIIYEKFVALLDQGKTIWQVVEGVKQYIREMREEDEDEIKKSLKAKLDQGAVQAAISECMESLSPNCKPVKVLVETIIQEVFNWNRGQSRIQQIIKFKTRTPARL